MTKIIIEYSPNECIYIVQRLAETAQERNTFLSETFAVYNIRMRFNASLCAMRPAKQNLLSFVS